MDTLVEAPVATFIGVAEVARVKVGATWTPVPLKLTVCGLPMTLSVMEREALVLPAAEGRKVTESVQ